MEFKPHTTGQGHHSPQRSENPAAKGSQSRGIKVFHLPLIMPHRLSSRASSSHLPWKIQSSCPRNVSIEREEPQSRRRFPFNICTISYVCAIEFAVDMPLFCCPWVVGNMAEGKKYKKNFTYFCCSIFATSNYKMG